MAHEYTRPDPPAVPEGARTACYAAGTLLGLGVAPALLALGLTEWAAAVGPVGGAFSALAFGYRPTRGSRTAR